jgi:predicted DNA-binding transcriptional regulator AlpA
MTDEYYGLLMNKKINAVWLTIERMAELKGCSNRTVWRFIDKHRMHTVKRQVKIGTAKVLKTFVLPDPETLELEFADTYKSRLAPKLFLETVIPIGERLVASMLVYGYKQDSEASDG